MRTYGAITTALLTALLTIELAFAVTSWDVIEIAFVTMLVTWIVTAVYFVVTEPRKKKRHHWERCGDLEVMVQGKWR